MKKKRLLLINPWIYDFSAFDLWSKPVGLLYVTGFLESLGYEIHYLDCMDKYHPAVLEKQKLAQPKVRKYGTGPFYRDVIEKPAVLDFVPRRFSRYGIPETAFMADLEKIPAPDAVLVTSVMTYWYPGPKRVVELVRRAFPGVPVILGGIYATLLPEHAKKQVKPDYLISGPGEVEAARLLSNILADSPRDFVLPEVLDDFPPPAYHLVRQNDYLVVMTSRGCPYHCTFCATDRISGGFAQRNPESVVAEIQSLYKKFRTRDFAFYDDALLLNKKEHIIPILEMLAMGREQLRFHTPNGLHARQIDENIARLFYQNRFKTIRLSFESVRPERLADMKNKVTPGDLELAVGHLEKAGYRRKELEAYVLMGLPEQPAEEVYESILYVNSLGIKVRLASFSPIPGTIDYRRAVESGQFPADADPLLMNKSIYPLFRSTEAYNRFHNIRQFVNILNDGTDRGVNLFKPPALKEALKQMLG